VRLELSWSARTLPLVVEACWAEGKVTRALQARLARGYRPDLRAAQVGGVLVLLGSDLPWVEGLTYLGREGNLFLPTLWQPSLPAAWIEARLHDFGDAPWALVPSGTVVGLSQASVLS